MRIGLVGVGRIGAFHAATLRELAAVEQVIVADVNTEAARAVADQFGGEHAADTDALLASGLDGLVIAAATTSHANLLRQGIAAGIPTFCEKPVAATLPETIDLARLAGRCGVPVQIGFQRRFDDGYRRVAAAVRSGRLGWLHTIRANTHDQSPPAAAYIPTSGGIFRDCNIHDFDIIRFVTGREVESVFATGANRGERFFADAGDVDTGAAVLTLDDSTLALVSSTRYNGAGHDVRFEALGSAGAMAVGLDHSLALRSAEEGVDFPSGPVHGSFMGRFHAAYRAELTAFAEMVRGERTSPCTVQDALEAFRAAEACEISRREGRPVHLKEVETT